MFVFWFAAGFWFFTMLFARPWMLITEDRFEIYNPHLSRDLEVNFVVATIGLMVLIGLGIATS